MANKPLSQFERRQQGSVPPSQPQPPAKRSHHVVLLVMGTVAVGSTAYMLMPRECTPAQPGTMPTVSSPAECPSRGSSSSSHGGSGGSSSRSSYYGSDSSSHSPAGATTDASAVKRGGFGSSAHAFSSHFSFGG
jgi:hypothetical protein